MQGVYVEWVMGPGGIRGIVRGERNRSFIGSGEAQE